MEETYLLKHPGVKKKILAGGTGPLPHFPPGTKIVFHFQTLKDNFERTVIDDSRLAKRPAEIFVGKLFKMEVWEVLLMSMRVGEVAEFWCDAMHTGLYPMVSKGMRLIAQGKDPLEGQRHMCGMGNMFNYSSTGWPELDELMREPQALIFIMELIQVGDPMSYKRESWMMEKDEKLKEVPSLHMQGNALVRQGRFREASARYQEAVLLLRTVKSREMPGDEDYINLSRLINPLVLNYCQCMLELNEFYEVILHTSELLEKHKDCVKAYYKRAKAYAAVWDEKEARKDFNMVANLDSSLAPLIRKELKNLSERMKEKYWEEKESYWNILETEKKADEEEEDVEEKEEEEEEEGKRSEDREPAEEEESTATVVEEELQSKESQQEVKQAVQAETKVANEEEGNSADAKTETNQSSPSVTEGKDWQQMLRLVMFLQDEGNFRFKEHRYEEASGKFKEALEYVDFLQTKEVKYKGEDWESLEKVRLPLTLNLSQCLLELQDFQRVVELNDKLLKRNRGNIKALYQRARAHSALCNEEDARRDYAKVERLDPKFKPIVRQEMKRLGENIRAMHVRQKKNYWESSREKWGPGGGKAGRNKATKEVEGAKVEKKKKVGREEGAGGKSVTESAGNAVKEDEAEVKKTEGTSEEGKTKVTKVKFREGVKEGKEKCGEEKAESVAVLGETETEPDNRGAHEDTQPAADTAARDNVATRRSGADKKKTKVKCQSSAAQGNVKERPGNKGTNDKTESGSSVQSGSTKRSQLSGTNLHSAEVAGERERSVTQTNPSKAEEEEMRCVDGGKEREGDNLDEQHSEATGDKTEPEIQTQNRKNDSAAKKSKRKQKKKK